jgi:hypoxanthine-guanine phosphoribosyltransferase
MSLASSGLKNKSTKRPCHTTYDFYGTDCEDRYIGGTAFAAKKDIPHTCVDLPSVLSIEAKRV